MADGISPELLGRLLDEQGGALALFAAQWTDSPDDCVQEAFVQAWRSLPRFETRSAFGTWLHRIAVNTVLQQARRRHEVLGSGDSVEREVAEVLADPHAADPARSRDLEAAIASEQLGPLGRRPLDPGFCEAVERLNGLRKAG